MASNSRDEPKTGPQSDHWYDLRLGSSFKSDSSNKFCTLRYEFKPASIDKTKPGSLHKTKENRVSVEFHNNQLGKPKVTFEGSSEEYKENDAVLFFDGESFRLDRLHRAVKQLRHLRKPGESVAAASAASAAQSVPAPDPRLSPVGKGARPANIGRSTFQTVPPVPVEVERIDIGRAENPGPKPSGKGAAHYRSDPPKIAVASPISKNEEVEEHQDIDIDDLFGSGTPEEETAAEEKENGEADTNAPHQNDTDDEIADVDDSGDEVERGPNAAEALRAQVNAEERDEQTSSSSSSSGSGSSASGSGSGSSSSSGSEGSDEDSVNSI